VITLKNFIDLTHDEAIDVLSWRNHESISTWMYSTQAISLDAHLAFIKSLKTSTDKLYFVVIKNGNPIGVIDLVDITSTTASLGLYANPFSDRKGIGTIILRALMRYAYDTLELEILRLEYFCDNEKAKTLYEKFDFAPIGKKEQNGQKIICMEHRREHWTL
jgi:UDP-4-amino-4,6-dideoxy-N-acetyl-beta-L-altrosamine N-acetyltransferase